MKKTFFSRTSKSLASVIAMGATAATFGQGGMGFFDTTTIYKDTVDTDSVTAEVATDAPTSESVRDQA